MVPDMESTTKTILAVATSVIVATGIAFVATRSPTPPLCPEVVVMDARGEPRNAAGKIRFCWPGQRKCHCDRDRDCYALEGYVACTPRTSPAPRVDAGRVDTGPRDTGVRDVPAPRDVVVQRDTGTPPTDIGPTPIGVRAFPGAEGFGATATGGRGGRVIYVTNLNVSGPGSFQDAVAQTGRRYVLFKVSGVIRTDIQVRHGDVTIAGQTSPGGITVQGFHTTEEPYCDQHCGSSAVGVQNFIVRHLRSRPSTSAFPDGLRLRYARNGILDHLSIGNAQDEAVEISYTNGITIQDSLLAETIGGHSTYGGMLINYTNPAAGYALDRLSVVRTVWNRIEGRMPEFSRESGTAAAGTTMNVELVNNLIWDQRYFIDVNPTIISGSNSGAYIFYNLNWVGNFAHARPQNHFGLIWIQSSGGRTSAYFNDNRSQLWAGRQDWDLNYCCNDYQGEANARPSWGRTTPHAFPTVNVMPSTSVRSYAAANAGAFPRDPMDTRLMGFVSSGSLDSRPINVNPVGDALFLVPNPSPVPADGDNDGMPDAWENIHGLNPTVQDHNGTTASRTVTGVEGYTNLECYLNDLATRRTRGTP